MVSCMKWKLVRNCIFTAAVMVLPGCLAMNAVLGVLGYLGTGPVQYAGTAYSITEYTYEYVVNDKTPDQTIKEKFAWIIPAEEEPEQLEFAKTFRQPDTPGPSGEMNSEVIVAEATLGASRALTLTPEHKEKPTVTIASLPPALEMKTATAKPRRVQRQRHPRKKSPPAVGQAPGTATGTPPAKATQHVYVQRETDPLLERLNRLEMAFCQAEDIVSNHPAQGLLLSVQSDGTEGGTRHGINGSWSIRHRVMEHAPYVSPDSITDASLSLETGQEKS